MNNLNLLDPSQSADRSAAEVSIRIGARAAFDASILSTGLLSVGVLVSGILASA
jgi:hypothetical protein